MSIVGVLFVLLLINGYFAAAEIAVVSSDPDDLKEALGKRANHTLVKVLLDDPTFFFSTVQVGVTLAGFLMSSVSAVDWIGPLSTFLADLGLRPNRTLALIVITAFIALLSIVFGELIPKTLAVKYRKAFAPFALVWLGRSLYLLYPIAWLLSLLQKVVLRSVGISNLEYTDVVSDEELLRLIQRGRTAGHFLEQEEQMIKSVLEFTDTVVREIMTPRLAVFWLDSKVTVEHALRTMLDSGYSRALLCDGSLDNVMGLLHIKDLMRLYLQGNPADGMDKVKREVLFVPETEKISEVFFQMRRLRSHLAVVVDEYGAVAGVVTLEDILEELVGEIRDEYDQEEEPIRVVEKRDDYVKALVLGQVSIDDVNDALNLDLPSEEVDTIAGFVLLHLQHFPQVGERFQYANATFTIISVVGKRIDKVLIEIASEEVGE
ncbi:HlyC/CorC family transporter [Coprothermobacteraceae bacterium]|nr:HlyC/CorC family transporter [Coprothermobacteraceae bacterium]